MCAGGIDLPAMLSLARWAGEGDKIVSILLVAKLSNPDLVVKDEFVTGVVNSAIGR